MEFHSYVHCTCQCGVLWVKLIPLKGESRELDSVQLGVYEGLRYADLIDEHSTRQGLLQVDGIQWASIVVVFDFQYDEANCDMTACI